VSWTWADLPNILPGARKVLPTLDANYECTFMTVPPGCGVAMVGERKVHCIDNIIIMNFLPPNFIISFGLAAV